MKTIKKVEFCPVFVEFVPKELEQGNIYISEKYNTSSHLCLCGCGELVVIPFNRPNQWSFSKNEKGVSFSPSIGNYNFECKSHYVIKNNVANFI